MPRLIKCIKCNGEGYYLVETTYHGERNQISRERCQECDGLGQVKIEEMISQTETTTYHYLTDVSSTNYNFRIVMDAKCGLCKIEEIKMANEMVIDKLGDE